MSWQQNFSDIILDRGFDYYSNGAVKIIRRNNDIIIATVSGTYDYSVEISYKNGLMKEIYCSCPYADDGNYCKHMAALLYTIENDTTDSDCENEEYVNKKINITSNKPSNEEKLHEIINNLDISIIRKELIGILENDNDIMANFLLKYNKSKETISNYILKKRKTA